MHELAQKNIKKQNDNHKLAYLKGSKKCTQRVLRSETFASVMEGQVLPMVARRKNSKILELSHRKAS
jgi:hypothetical protein